MCCYSLCTSLTLQADGQHFSRQRRHREPRSFKGMMGSHAWAGDIREAAACIVMSRAVPLVWFLHACCWPYRRCNKWIKITDHHVTT
jgi:hypothetical protein